MNNHIKFFHSIHFKIALVFALILLISLEVVGGVFISQLEKRNVSQYEKQIQLPVYVDNSLAYQLNRKNQTKANHRIYTLLSNANDSNADQIQVIDTKGTIRGTNQINNRSIVGQKTTDRDVKNALHSNKAINKTTYDQNDSTRYYTIVVPLVRNQSEGTVGLLYMRASLNPVYKSINEIIVIYILAALITILIGLMVSIAISQAITRPIDEMKKQTLQITHGNYSGRVRVYEKDELGQLALAINNLSVKIQESQETTESEKRRLHSVLANMNDGVLATDPHGNVIISNAKALDFLNVKSENVIGHQVLKVLNVSHKYSLAELFKHPREIQVDLSSKDQPLILHAHFSLIQRNSGFINGLVCVLHDVTEQERIDENRKQFVSNVSHELRTPLTGMHAYLETLLTGAWRDKQIAPKFLKVTQNETDRMIRMVRDLLMLSKLDSGTQKLQPELLNLNEFLSHVLDRYSAALKRSSKAKVNHRIIKKFTDQTLWVEIDPSQFTRVINNLMDNAFKYSKASQPVTCSLYETHHRVILSVKDLGIGIPQRAQDHIFERFYRVDKARSRAEGGSGLGLAISKSIVEALGGNIWVDSTEGQGSTFYISLPYEPVKGDLWNEENR